MDLLRKHERASQDTVLVKQGSEGKEFWSSFSHDQGIYKHVSEWNHLFINVREYSNWFSWIKQEIKARQL